MVPQNIISRCSSPTAFPTWDLFTDWHLRRRNLNCLCFASFPSPPQNIPTLGSVAITMVLHNCDEVAVAGFGYDMNSPNAPLHYYENIKMSAIKEVKNLGFRIYCLHTYVKFNLYSEVKQKPLNSRRQRISYLHIFYLRLSGMNCLFLEIGWWIALGLILQAS